eukprot:gene8866-815_t
MFLRAARTIKKVNQRFHSKASEHSLNKGIPPKSMYFQQKKYSLLFDMFVIFGIAAVYKDLFSEE